MTRIEQQLRPNEKVLWQAKPVRKAFVFSSGFAPATIPGLFFLMTFLFFSSFSIFTLPLLLFYLIPLALFFGVIIWAFLAYENTEYLLSDQRLITQTGAIGLDTRFVDLEKIQEVNVRIGVFDRLFGTGSIMAPTAGQAYLVPQGSGWGRMRPSLASLKEPYDVQKLLQEAIREVKQTKG